MNFEDLDPNLCDEIYNHVGAGETDEELGAPIPSPFPLVPKLMDEGDTEQLYWWPTPPYQRFAMTVEEIQCHRNSLRFLRAFPARGARRAGFLLLKHRLEINWYSRFVRSKKEEKT